MADAVARRRILWFWVRKAAGATVVVASFGAALLCATQGPLGVIAGVLLMIPGAILLGFPLAERASQRWGSLLFPDEYPSRPAPRYSPAEAKAKRGEYEAAMAAYTQIAEDYPEEVKPYVDMIEIAVSRLGDGARAHSIYEQGMACLEDPDAKDVLARMYRGIKSKLDEKPSWAQPHTLGLPEHRVEKSPTVPKWYDLRRRGGSGSAPPRTS
jgi:hypothetical protein